MVDPRFDAAVRGNATSLHHEQHFDQRRNTRRRLAMTNISLHRPEMQRHVPRPALIPGKSFQN